MKVINFTDKKQTPSKEHADGLKDSQDEFNRIINNKNPKLVAWVMIDNDGDVITDFMAGETGPAEAAGATAMLSKFTQDYYSDG